MKMIKTSGVLQFPRTWSRDSIGNRINHTDFTAVPVLHYNYIIKESTIVDLNNWLGNNRIDTLSNNDKVYFCPNAKLSRAKFRDWARGNGITVVLDPSNADVLVLDRNILNIDSSSICHLKPVTDYNIYYDKGWRVPKDTEPDYIQVSEESEEGEIYYTFHEYNISKFINNGLDMILSIPKDLPNKNYILIEDLTNQMQELIMDFESFESIYMLLKSGSDDNIKIALELTSNYNIKESLFYLGLLKLSYPFSASDFKGVSLAPLKKVMLHDELGYYHHSSYADSTFNQIDSLIHTMRKDNCNIDIEALGFFVKNTISKHFNEIPITYCDFKQVGNNSINLNIQSPKEEEITTF